MKKKVKRYQEGGITINQQSPLGQNTNTQVPSAASGYFNNTTSAYPFQSDSSASPATNTDSGVNQTFNMQPQSMKKGGSVKQKASSKTYKSGGSVKSSTSKRGDGCAIRGKTKGKIV